MNANSKGSRRKNRKSHKDAQTVLVNVVDKTKANPENHSLADTKIASINSKANTEKVLTEVTTSDATEKKVENVQGITAAASNCIDLNLRQNEKAANKPTTKNYNTKKGTLNSETIDTRGDEKSSIADKVTIAKNVPKKEKLTTATLGTRPDEKAPILDKSSTKKEILKKEQVDTSTSDKRQVEKVPDKAATKMEMAKKEQTALTTLVLDKSQDERVPISDKKMDKENITKNDQQVDLSLDKRQDENTLISDKTTANKEFPKKDMDGTTASENISSKSKSELKAERRAKQEAQRAAKALKKEDKSAESKVVPKVSKSVRFAPDVKLPVSPVKLQVKQVKMVSHLPQYEKEISVVKAVEEGVHPAIIKLGLQYSEGTICGSNSRCVNFIHTLVQIIRDFKMPENKDFNVAVYSMCIEPAVEFLEKCRPISVGMKNVCKMLREEISNISKDDSENEVKKKLEDSLNLFVENHISKAHDSIVNLAKDKIDCKDVILTYGCSYIVKLVLKEAHKHCKFRVIVVDGRPKLEGRNMLRYLVENGIECTYVLINAVAHVMPEATKVFLGAHALLANGCVMSRVGSSQVALVAKAFNKPVLVCCETYKFSDMVQTDSFVVNELGNPEDLVETNHRNNALSQWKTANTLNILNLYYDVTPPNLVTVLINEGYVVPCSSVPVVLRVRPSKSESII